MSDDFSLKSVPTLQLLIELMYDGRCGFIPNLHGHEPLDISAIGAALRERTGADCGDDFEDWYDWFMAQTERSTAEERAILHTMKHSKQRQDYFLRAAAERANSRDPSRMTDGDGIGLPPR